MSFRHVALRLAIAATLAVSGIIHAHLYIQSYRYVPTVGAGFLIQAGVFCALAVLIVAGAPQWFSWVGALLSMGALIAFALSRTVGLFGFTERGWQPAPGAVLAVTAEAATVILVAAAVVPRIRQRALVTG